jgi:cation diffusion facilitator family transporter
MMSRMPDATDVPAREKQSVALSSLLAAGALTTLKLVVGVLTGSLGILSEAAHSGLDFIAAAITYLSVRIADQPADPSHPFGHGKVEHLSAFVQTALLAVTSAWIVFEAVRRLFFHDVHVALSIWAFGVLGLSATVDLLRSRSLARAARTYQSQALEADALHFATDVYSTGAVVLGLLLVYVGEVAGLNWLRYADPVAALVVAAVSVYIGTRLGNRSVGALLDAAPEGAPDRIADIVSGIPGVLGSERIRVRQSGAKLFIDLRITLESNIPLEHAESIAEAVTARIQERYPAADVVVDTAPHSPSPDDLVERIRSIAHRENFHVHDVTAIEVKGRPQIDLDLEVDPALELTTAHERATSLEALVRRELPEVRDINVHIEPMRKKVVSAQDAPRIQADTERALREVVRSTPGVIDCHSIDAHRVGSEVVVTVHCTLQPGLSVERAHDITERLELKLRERVQRDIRVNIHAEPEAHAES